MKVLLVAEDATDVRALARELAGRGQDVIVVAAGAERSSTGVDVQSEEPQSVTVHTLRRPDLHPEHWHKGRSPAVAAAFRELVRAAQPDVVHLHHWRRLSSDLVLAAAREGVPAVVTLSDFWTSCPLGSRVRPKSGEACDSPVGPNPCVACAGGAAPATPWVDLGQGFVQLAERQNGITAELRLARAVIVESEERAREQSRFLDTAPEVVATPAELDEIYRRALAAGAPTELPAETWFEDRMRTFAIEQWDDAFAGSD